MAANAMISMAKTPASGEEGFGVFGLGLGHGQYGSSGPSFGGHVGGGDMIFPRAYVGE